MRPHLKTLGLLILAALCGTVLAETNTVAELPRYNTAPTGSDLQRLNTYLEVMK